MIQVEDLTKRYGVTTAVRNLSFHVKRGEILGFLGPNGAGKTTCIRILTGYVTPSSGSVRVAGVDIRTDPLKARRRIGYLPESVPVYPEMTVREYLRFVADMKAIDRTERTRHINQITGQCGLMDVSGKLCGHLSKGYRQRLGLAQALIGDPDVLILDEPTSGLDPRQIIEIRGLIRSLGGDRTVILSSHILPEVSQLCHRVIILNKGQLIAVDTPDNLDKSITGQNIIILQVSGSASIDDLMIALTDLPGTTQQPQIVERKNHMVTVRLWSDVAVDSRPEIARRVVTGGWNLHGLMVETQSLEEIFIKLVTEETEVA
ncbi:ATP-binding cassette domain-containing protein [bacterium]|nr:ATP-binding cassette domain-containing protein [candidate division CSSED10-310 bacterium]